VSSQRPNPEASNPGSAPRPDGELKPYNRPQILSREPLESLAATCTGKNAKAVNGVGGCKTGSLKS
jgi:hypothetical protein